MMLIILLKLDGRIRLGRTLEDWIVLVELENFACPLLDLLSFNLFLVLTDLVRLVSVVLLGRRVMFSSELARELELFVLKVETLLHSLINLEAELALLNFGEALDLFDGLYLFEDLEIAVFHLIALPVLQNLSDRVPFSSLLENFAD